MRKHFNWTVLAGAVLLAGCSTVQVDQLVAGANTQAGSFTQGQLQLGRTETQRQDRARLTGELLSRPLTMDTAVQAALANSPSLQALLAQGWADAAAAQASGRMPNPVFSFERLRTGEGLELGRLLSVGLLDLLMWPQRHAVARNQVEQIRVQLTASVVEQVAQVRQAWVRAVAAQQLLAYAHQVNDAAQASAELARRMQQAGNFTKLQRARQHVFYADATAQLASAQHAATAAREELVRALGLDDAQSARLVLPDRLPDLPRAPLATPEVTAAAVQQRLDWQMARLQLEAAGQRQGLELAGSFVDVELGGRHDTTFDKPGGQRANRNGFELDLRLPLFDWGTAKRDALNAQSLAAANRYESVVRNASSQLRASYSAYRTAYDLVTHFRDEIVPLRKTISEENVLRYNGMLIGVFELLADTREQIAAVMASINAQQQFWLADAALSAALIGQPLASAGAPASTRGNISTNESQGH